MQMTDTDEETAVTTELAKLPPCEGATHARGVWGHDAAEPAAWLVGLPCGRTFLMCDGWVQHARADNHVVVHRAADGSHSHKVSELTMIPLDVIR